MRCLDLGILGRDISLNWEQKAVDAAFSGMDPDEARKMKRKFRKIARKMIKKERWVRLSRRQKRHEVIRQIFIKAWQDAIRLQGPKPDNDV